tara:strand:+ start:1699 stop:1854 length:156 start_codon:yes stop_codon:yes gene_type:complete
MVPKASGEHSSSINFSIPKIVNLIALGKICDCQAAPTAAEKYKIGSVVEGV